MTPAAPHGRLERHLAVRALTTTWRRNRMAAGPEAIALVTLAFALRSGAAVYFFRAVTTNIRSISSRGASYSMRLLTPQTPRSPHLKR